MAWKGNTTRLRGTAGSSQVEVNAIGRVIRELRRAEGRPQAHCLTLDLPLQRYATERLAQYRRASAVVMDVHNGEILAMVSVPSFDPNGFNEGLDPGAWKALIENPDAPLTNKAISGQYAPGSTFKLAVMLAALEAGIPPERQYFCTGFTELGDQRFHCWHQHGHGLLGMIDAMRESCDVYFYELALKVGVDRIAAMARKLGLGVPLDLDVPGERGGLIPTRAWKKEHFDKFWLGRDASPRSACYVRNAAATRRNDGPRGQWRVYRSAAPDAKSWCGRQSAGPPSFHIPAFLSGPEIHCRRWMRR